MADQVQAYQDSLSALAAAQRKAEEVVNRIKQVSNTLADWRKVVISNGRRPFPAIAVRKSMRSVDLRQWPTGEQLEEALSDWHMAHQAAENAWSALPPDRRQGLSPPG